MTKDLIAEVAEQDKLMRQVEDTMRTEHPIQEVGVPSRNYNILYVISFFFEEHERLPYSLSNKYSRLLHRHEVPRG